MWPPGERIAHRYEGDRKGRPYKAWFVWPMVGANRGGFPARRVVAPYKILPLEGRRREAPEGFPACAQISVILRPQAEESFVTGCEKMLRFAQHDTVTFLASFRFSP